MTDEEGAREKIDSQLESSGWTETTDSENGTGYYTEYPTNSGPVDYALLIEGVPVSVVEAKKPSVLVKSIFDQAERYARGLPTDTEYSCSVGQENYAFPIVFGANSREIKLFDLRIQSPKSREIPRFPTKDNLQKLTRIDYNSVFETINSGLIDDIDPKLWEHQSEAAHAVFDIWEDNEQKALTHLATGTGKTRMAMAISWAFLESGLGDKILFIPNQRPLANDAYESFRDYEVDGRDLRMGERFRVTNLLKDDTAYQGADIVTTTIQKVWTMAKEENPFSLNEFDLIISDESHRSIYNEENGYGYALDQLDAYHLGLTATPTKRTIDWFDGNIAYQYTYTDGVEDNNLVPFSVHKVETELTMNGVERNGKIYKSQDIGTKLQIPQTNIIMGDSVRNYIEEDPNKDIDEELILIFACNDRHAIELVEDLRQEVFSDKPDTFVKRATYSADRPHENIKSFEQKYKNPKVLVTVQMVEEGVDIPELEHIVLMKPVHSPVTYNQMMGRGTRTSGGKDSFVIHDCLGAVEHFGEKGYGPFNTTEFEGATQDTGSSGTPTERKDNEYIVVDEEDELRLSQTIFQLESGVEKTKPEYRNLIEEFITNNHNKLSEFRLDSENISEYNQKLTKLFLGKDRSFRTSLIAKAFEINESEAEYSDIVDYVLYDVDLTEKRTEKVINSLNNKIRNTPDGEYIKILLHNLNKKRLTVDDFYSEPLSEIGFTTIEENIITPIDEFIDEYNTRHLTIAKRKV